MANVELVATTSDCILIGVRIKILIAGATGYIGTHLLKGLEADGRKIRCLARRPEVLLGRVAPETEVVQGDVFNAASLDVAMKDISVAYYLVHSMGATGDFEEKDKIAAENFAKAAKINGVQKIVYLGGLAHTGIALSRHLRSRQEVGAILRAHGPQIIEFRASIIIGAGSLSFEMIRSLTERLPIMITPKWVSQRAQPIAIDDVIHYLTASLKVPLIGNRIFEIGGRDQMSYREIMQEYARQRGLRRFMISVPFLTPRLSSLWLALVTPLYARIGRKLVDSLIHETVVRENSALDSFGFRPRGLKEAIQDAIALEDSEMAVAHWFDAFSSSGLVQKWGGVRFGSRIVDSRTVEVRVNRLKAFEPIQIIGGKTGWYYATWLWRLRSWIDLFLGGVGFNRGRTRSASLRIGDVVDWWRIENFVQGKLLLLRAEMRVPGRAWLQFEVTERGDGAAICQTAIFDPVGLLGILYWYLLYPVHYFIFRGMLKEIGKQAERFQ